MKLNGKLSQRCWQEVKHCVLDDTMGKQKNYRPVRST